MLFRETFKLGAAAKYKWCQGQGHGVGGERVFAGTEQADNRMTERLNN